jgi:hypothetical protein
MTKNILQLKHNEAREFLLQEESYNTVRFPPYIKFKTFSMPYLLHIFNQYNYNPYSNYPLQITLSNLLHLMPFGQQTWPLLLKIEHTVKLH